MASKKCKHSPMKVDENLAISVIVRMLISVAEENIFGN